MIDTAEGRRDAVHHLRIAKVADVEHLHHRLVVELRQRLAVETQRPEVREPLHRREIGDLVVVGGERPQVYEAGQRSERQDFVVVKGEVFERRSAPSGAGIDEIAGCRRRERREIDD